MGSKDTVADSVVPAARLPIAPFTTVLVRASRGLSVLFVLWEPLLTLHSLTIKKRGGGGGGGGRDEANPSTVKG